MVAASLDMTMMELKALKEAVDDTIDIYENKLKGRTSSFTGEASRQKANSDRLMDFKIEE